MINSEFNYNIDTICKLYYNYKSTSKEKLTEFLEKVPVFQLGKNNEILNLSEKSKNLIKEKQRTVSLSFDAFETDNVNNDYEICEEFYYLVKSSSRFFLKPDIGEIFDAINRHYLFHLNFGIIFCPKFYTTLPETQGEHFLMKGYLLRNKEIISTNHYLCIKDFINDYGKKLFTKGLYYYYDSNLGAKSNFSDVSNLKFKSLSEYLKIEK